MITLIGTGHVFDLSQPLLNIFNDKQPDIMCVELDKERFKALMLKTTDPEKYKEAKKKSTNNIQTFSTFSRWNGR